MKSKHSPNAKKLGMLKIICVVVIVGVQMNVSVQAKVDKRKFQEYNEQLGGALKIDRMRVAGKWITQSQLKTYLDEVFNVENGRYTFFTRWDRAIRYYVEGLDDKETLREFHKTMNEFSEITGLDVRSHDKIYWPEKASLSHGESPGKLHTNAIFLFSQDMEKAFDYESVTKFYEIAKLNAKDELAKWKQKKVNKPDESINVAKKISSNTRGVLFHHQIFDLQGVEKNKKEYRAYFMNELFRFFMTSAHKPKSTLIKKSLSNRDKLSYVITRFNEFDRVLLKAAASPSSDLPKGVPLPIEKILATNMIFNTMWTIFNQE